MFKKILAVTSALLVIAGLTAVLFVSGIIPGRYLDLIKEKITGKADSIDALRKGIENPPEADLGQQEFGAEIDLGFSDDLEITPKEENDTEEDSEKTEKGKEENKKEEAKEKIEKATPKKKVTYGELLERGEKYFDEEQYQNALDYFQKAKVIDKENPITYLKIADCYYFLDNIGEMKKATESLRQIAPQAPQYYFLLGRAFLAEFDLEKAEENFSKLTDKNQKGVFYRGVIASLKDDHKKAQELLGAAKELAGDEGYIEKTSLFLDAYEEFYLFEDGKLEHLWGLLARAANLAKMYHTAENFCIKSLKRITNYVDVWNQLGYSRLGLRQFDLAEDAFKESYQLDPSRVETHYFLAFTFDNKNDVNKALTFYEIALKNDFSPRYVIYKRLADLYFSVKQYRQAAEFYKKTLSEGDHSVKDYVRPVWIYIEHLNEPEEALTLAFSANKNYPQEAMSKNLLGWAKLSMNEMSDAKEYLEKAIEIEPDFASPYLNLGIIYQKEGDDRQAKEFLKKAYELGKGTSVGNLAAKIYDTL